MHHEISEADLLRLYDPNQYGAGEFYRANISRQRGSGFGSIFKSVGRFLLPLVRKHVLPYAAKTAKNVMDDVLEGRNVGQSLKEHGLAGIKDVGRSVFGSQSGSGSRLKRKTSTSVQIKRKKHKKQRIKSIFE
jgi:hypothetical protein